MNTLATLMAATVLAAQPQIELTNINGNATRGTLQELNQSTVVLEQEQEKQNFPVKEVVRITFPADEQPKLITRDPLQISLIDGNRLYCKNLTTAGRQADLTSSSLSTFSLNTQFIQSVMFKPEETALKSRWQELLSKPRKRDALIIAKGEPGNRVLDFVEGVIGNIGKEDIAFLLGDRNMTVNRSKLYGIMYARAAVPEPASLLCQAELNNQQSLKLSNLTFDGKDWQGELLTNVKISIPQNSLRSIDYSLGKIVYLSDLTPQLELFANWHDLLSDRWLSLSGSNEFPAADNPKPAERFSKYTKAITKALADYGRRQLEKTQNQEFKIDFLVYRSEAGRQIEGVPWNDALALFYQNKESLKKLTDKNANHFYFRKNHTANNNQRLSLNGKTYNRGLWIHSWTMLSYKLDGQYRKFQALMGIDGAVASNGLGDVQVIIRGDDRVLLDAEVNGLDDPRQLDIDVEGIKQLEIEVGYGKNYAISDHLNLVEAKLLK